MADPVVESKKPIFIMVLLGMARHGLVIVGMWLKARGWIDEATHAQLTSPSTAMQLVSWALIVAPIAWSAAQKWQVWGWLKTKVHLPAAAVTVPQKIAAANATPQQIITASPGPNSPI